MIQAGQLLAVTKPNGLFIIYTKSLSGNVPNHLIKILHEDKIYSKYLPIGEIFLCLEATYHDCEDVYGLKVLWRDQIYYIFCNIGDVKAIDR
jgi:hypothetical protein